MPPLEDDTVPSEEAPEPAAASSGEDDEPGALREALRKALDPVLAFHQRHPVYFWLSITGAITAILVAGSYLAPEVVLHEFLWKNFWGPTVTDAQQISEEVRYGIKATEDYTLLSEIIYGLILAGALSSLYVHLFKKRGVDVDSALIASLLPYIFFGPLARALEDASLFCQQGTPALSPCEPGIFSYVFISPFIYVLTAAAVIGHLLLAYHTREADQATQYKVIGGWLAAQAALYAAVFFGLRDQFVILVHPVTVLVLVVLSFGVYHLARHRGGSHLHWGLVATGLPMALVPVVLIGQWELAGPWLEPSRDPARTAIPVVAVLTLLVVGAVALFGVLLQRSRAEGASGLAASLVAPLNLGLVAGHMIDGFATFTAICSQKVGQLCTGAAFLGVDAGGYGEKHPVSEVFLGGDVHVSFPGFLGTLLDAPVNWLLDGLEVVMDVLNGWGFPMMKLLLVITIVVLIDRAAREGDEDPTLVGLVKLAVLILGLAPGIRDVARVAMGV